MGDTTTTIRILRGTRKRLAELGKKTETYDDIINRLADFYEKHSRKP